MFFAREGAVVGCVRLVEVAPQTLVVEDMVVDAQRRRRGIGRSLMQAAMNSRGGALYVRTDEAFAPFFERLGFTAVGPGDIPDPVTTYLGGGGAAGGGHTVLRARA